MTEVERQRGFLFHQDDCIGCRACQIACKDLHDHQVGINWRLVRTLEFGRYPQPEVVHISLSCNHCAIPACVDACPAGGIRKRAEDGAVLHDDTFCIACLACVDACPYGAIQQDPVSGKVGACDLCGDLMARGEAPACVDACPMDALHLIWIDEYSADLPALRGLPDPKGTRPSLRVRPHRHGV